MSQYTTYPVCLIPFLQNNDQTREQMSASQMKQALILEDAEVPLVGTGYENVEHLDLFIYKAKHDGKVILKTNKILLIQYDNEEWDYHQLEWYLESPLKKGDSFKQGDLLVNHISLEDGTLKFGKNVLTAYMECFGYCHEDSIVFSESAAKKFTAECYEEISFHISPNEVLLNLSDADGYKPLPEIGEKIKKNDPLALVKYLSNSPKGLFEEPKKITVDHDCEIFDIRVYINDWCKNYSEYNQYLATLLENSKHSFDQLTALKNQFKLYEWKDIVDLLNCDIHKHKGYITNHGTKINGVTVIIGYKFKRETKVGDKFANRHGNKGVISKIIPDDEMPMTPWGERIEVILGSLSIISRMNIGQLFELHSGLSMKFWKEQLLEIYKDDPKKAMENIKYSLSKIDQTDDKWYSNYVNKIIDEKGPCKEIIEDLILIQPPFQCMSYEDLKHFLLVGGADQDYEVEMKVENDDGEKEIVKIGPVPVGNMYIMKLSHTIESKLKARSVGNYARKTIQPSSNTKSKKKGQRLGEMEVWALMAYDAVENLKEINIKSDDLGGKINVLRQLYNTGFVKDVQLQSEPASLHLFRSYLNVLGLTF